MTELDLRDWKILLIDVPLSDVNYVVEAGPGPNVHGYV